MASMMHAAKRPPSMPADATRPFLNAPVARVALFVAALVLVGVALLLVAQDAEASHYRYGTLSWEQTGNGNEVQFTGQQAWRYSFYSPAPTLNGLVPVGTLYAGDGSPGIPISVEVTEVNQNQDWFSGVLVTSAGNGIIHAYPSAENGGQPWVAWWASNARLGQDPNFGTPPNYHINNPGDYMRLQTLVDLSPANDAPTTTLGPIQSCAWNSLCTFPLNFTDPNGDTLNYRLATSVEVEPGGTFFQPGPPDAPFAASVDAATGLVTWQTNDATTHPEVNNYYSMAVVASDGASEVTVDFFICLVPLVDDLCISVGPVLPPEPPCSLDDITLEGEALDYEIGGGGASADENHDLLVECACPVPKTHVWQEGHADQSPLDGMDPNAWTEAGADVQLCTPVCGIDGVSGWVTASDESAPTVVVANARLPNCECPPGTTGQFPDCTVECPPPYSGPLLDADAGQHVEPSSGWEWVAVETCVCAVYEAGSWEIGSPTEVDVGTTCLCPALPDDSLPTCLPPPCELPVVEAACRACIVNVTDCLTFCDPGDVGVVEPVCFPPPPWCDFVNDEYCQCVDNPGECLPPCDPGTIGLVEPLCFPPPPPPCEFSTLMATVCQCVEDAPDCPPAGPEIVVTTITGSTYGMSAMGPAFAEERLYVTYETVDRSACGEHVAVSLKFAGPLNQGVFVVGGDETWLGYGIPTTGLIDFDWIPGSPLGPGVTSGHIHLRLSGTNAVGIAEDYSGGYMTNDPDNGQAVMTEDRVPCS